MKLIFDIGSNIGNTVEIFINKAKKVICLEPNPSLASHLKSRFSGQNVIVDSRGLSNMNGTQVFNISNANTISTFSEQWINDSRFTNHYTWDEMVTVETVTLDTLLAEYGIPDYIKIDIEGYEYEALMSFTKLLENTIIAFEWAEEQKIKISHILEHLFNLGYKNFFFTEGDEVLFEDNIIWSNYENFMFLDYLTPERKEKWGMIYFKK